MNTSTENQPPKTFTDKQGNQWCLELNIGLCKKIRDQLDVDLIAADDRVFGQVLQKLSSDLFLLGGVLWLLLEPQCRERGLDEQQFAERMGGETIQQACDALLETLCLFCQNPSKRKIRLALLAKIREIETTVTERALHRLGEKALKTQEVDNLIERALAVGPWSTNSPESSGQTPTPSPSGNSSGWSGGDGGSSGGTPPS